MNYIFSYAASAPQYFSTTFKEAILTKLTDQQKKILVISSIAVSILTAMFIAHRCCFSKNSNSPPNSPNLSFGGGFKKPNYNSSPSDSPSSSPTTKKPVYGFSPVHSPSFSPTATHKNPFHSTTVPTYQGGKFSPVTSSPFVYQPYSPDPVKKPTVDPIKSAPRVIRPGLDGIEDEIEALQGDIHMQQQMVGFANATPPIIKDDEDFDIDLLKLQQQENIDEAEAVLDGIKDNLQKMLTPYPNMVREYLEGQYSSHSHRDSHEIYDHLVRLSGIMHTNADNKAFIKDCLTQIDAFLTHSLFTSSTEMCLQEQKKTDFIVFHEFLAIVDKHINTIVKTDQQLAMRLKVKLANLPLIDQEDTKTKSPIDRQALFPNAHLSEQDQVVILTDHFQIEEDKCIANVIFKIQGKNLLPKDLNKLAKMISDDRSYLSKENKNKLRNAITIAIRTTAPTGLATSILENLKGKLGGYGYSYGSTSVDFLNLHRASKAKKFFEKQIGLPENKIQIPRWYHATAHTNIAPIINSGQINVEHRQAFKGAWVSTRREGDFGGSVFCFSHRISKLDPNVFIGYEKGGEMNVKGLRWRGLQCPIPLADKTAATNISLFGVYQGADASVKRKVAEDLKKKNFNPVIVSIAQVDYIQRELAKTIGNPNLTAKWWGKADESHLERKF